MSVYIPEHQLFFNHVPRTGGTWVREVLFRVFGKKNCHTLTNRAISGVPKSHPLLSHIVYSKSFKPKQVFTFVRHPFGFYESAWLRLRQRRRRNALLRKFSWHPLHPAIDAWDDDFRVWVVRMCEQHPLWYTRLIDLYVGPRGAEFCGFIGKTEMLRDDLFGLLHTVDSTLDLTKLCEGLQRINVSERKGNIEWATHMHTAVQRSEHEVIERFYS